MKISNSKSDRLSPLSQLGGLQALSQVLESIPSNSSLPNVLAQPTPSYIEQPQSPKLPNSQQLQQQLLASIPRQENFEDIWHQEKYEAGRNSQQNTKHFNGRQQISLESQSCEHLQSKQGQDSSFLLKEDIQDFSSLNQHEVHSSSSVGSDNNNFSNLGSFPLENKKTIKANKSSKVKEKMQKSQSRLGKKGQKIRQLLSDKSKEEENSTYENDISDKTIPVSIVNTNNITNNENPQLYASNLMRRVVIQDMLMNNKHSDLQLTQIGNQLTLGSSSTGFLPSIYPLQFISNNLQRQPTDAAVNNIANMHAVPNSSQLLLGNGNVLSGFNAVTSVSSFSQLANQPNSSASDTMPQSQGNNLCAPGINDLELPPGSMGIQQSFSTSISQPSSCLSQMSPGSLTAVTALLSQLINSDNQQKETVAVNKCAPISATQQVTKDGSNLNQSKAKPAAVQPDMVKDHQKSSVQSLQPDALMSIFHNSVQSQSPVPQGPLLIPLNQVGLQNPENSVVMHQQLQSVLSSLISGLQGQLDATQKLIPPLLSSSLQQKQRTSHSTIPIAGINNSSQMSDVPYTCVPISPNKEVQVNRSSTGEQATESQLCGQESRPLGNQVEMLTDRNVASQLNNISGRNISNQLEQGLSSDNRALMGNSEEQLAEDSFLPQQTEHLYDEQHFLYNKTNMEPYLSTREENSAVGMEIVNKEILSNQVEMNFQGCQDVSDPNTQKNQMLLSHDSEEDLTNVPNMFKQYCLSCKAALLNDECQFHKINYNHIKDTPILSRARTSIPNCLALQPTSTFGNYNVYLGVWTKENIPAHTKFGPLVGKKTQESDSKDEKVPCFPGWKVFLDTRSEAIDMCDENECNWMMFIKPARCEKTQNLIAHQLGHHIYFFTTKEVFCGQELLYWFSKEYASLSGLPLLASGASLSECLICGKVFTDKTTRKLHMKEHPHYQKYKCHICDHLYSSLSSLNRHTMIHMGVKPHVCHVCHKTFTDNSNLKVHLKLHTGMKLFKCDICGKSFRQKAHLKTHMVIHTGKKNLKCYFCDKTFAREGDRKQHEYQHTKEKSFECEDCGKVFYKLQNYKCHLLIHTGARDFECQYCMKSFRRKFHLQRHMDKCQAKNEIFEEKDLILNNVDLKGILNSQ